MTPPLQPSHLLPVALPLDVDRPCFYIYIHKHIRSLFMIYVTKGFSYIFISIYISIYIIHPSFYLSIYISIYIYIYLSICLSVFLTLPGYQCFLYVCVQPASVYKLLFPTLQGEFGFNSTNMVSINIQYK